VRIEIEIDSLRLEGVGEMTAEELGALVEAELQRLVEVWGVPASLRQGEPLHLAGGTVRVAPGTPRQEVGAAVARHLAGSWFGTNGEGIS
jgi:hypothetical protein